MPNILTDNVFSADNHAGKIQYDAFDNKNRAYLFGVYLGDGCCSKFTRHYNFRIISEDGDVIERTMQIVNLLFNKNYHLISIKPNKTYLYSFTVGSNKNLFDMLISETGYKTHLPEFVMNSDREIKAEFVAGLMDTDGYISSSKNKFGQQRFSLGFVNSGDWLDQFIALLQSLGVKVGKKTPKRKYRSVNEKDCYQININLRSFIERGLYFNCQRKQRTLEKYKSSVRYQSY